MNVPPPVVNDQSPWPVLVLTLMVPVVAIGVWVGLCAVMVTGDAWQFTAVPASLIAKWSGVANAAHVERLPIAAWSAADNATLVLLPRPMLPLIAMRPVMATLLPVVTLLFAPGP